MWDRVRYGVCAAARFAHSRRLNWGRGPVAILCVAAALAACNESAMLDDAAVVDPVPTLRAVRDSATAAVETVARIQVMENDQIDGLDVELRLLGAPLTGTAWVDGTAINYAAGPQLGRDVLMYELEAEGQVSTAIVEVSIVTFDDPVFASDLPIVGQLAPAQAVNGLEYVPVDLDRPDIQALVPLALEILAAYGNPTSDLDRARAIREWVARTAIHPYPPFHPAGSTANLAVLPPNATWAQVNQFDSAKVESDSRYWSEVHFNGYAMLDRLLGTLDRATGLRADDGLMERVGSAHYRIRDIEEYRYVLCTYQDIIAISLWGAIGLQGLLLSTYGHDPAAVFIPDLGKWVYQDPTYNEEFVLRGEEQALSPLELLAVSLAGRKDQLVQRKMLGPVWSPDVYIDARVHERATYFGDGHPHGMNRMGTQLNNSVPTTPGFRVHLSQIRLPDLEAPFSDETKYKQAEPATVFPRLGARLTYALEGATQVEFGLESTHGSLNLFERRINSGPWERVASPDVVDQSMLRPISSRVSYRSMSEDGVTGAAFSVMLRGIAEAPGSGILLR